MVDVPYSRVYNRDPDRVQRQTPDAMTPIARDKAASEIDIRSGRRNKGVGLTRADFGYGFDQVARGSELNALRARVAVLEALVAALVPIISENATNETSAPGTTFVAPANGAGHAFVAPPSGKVMVILSDELSITRSSAACRLFASYRIGEGASVGGGTLFQDANLNYSLIAGENGASGDAAVVGGSRVDIVPGFVPGDTYNIQYRWRDTGTLTAASSLHRMVTTVPLIA